MLPRVASFAPASPLGRSRAKNHRLPLHPLETLLLWILTLHLIFLPWALGGVRSWAHFISAGLAVVGFGVALLPRTYSGLYTSGPDFRLLPWPKLVRFPIFWAGLLLVIYVAVQALNPAWMYVTDGQSWWLFPRTHISWLPTSVAASMRTGSPWGHLLVYVSAWLVGCSLWVGFTRRRTLHLFFGALAINGFVLAVLGTIEKLTDARKIFWFVDSPVPTFVGPFIYKNHGGAYLNLILALSAALTAWLYFRGLRRHEKSNPAGLFAFFGCLIAVNVFVSYSRGALFIMLLFLPLALAVFILYQIRNPALPRKAVIVALLVLTFGAFAGIGLKALSADRSWEHVKELFAERDTSIDLRRLATKASFDMYQDHWLAGTGASSFRYLFPPYQRQYPLIYGRNGRKEIYWEHVHNDLLEIPLELGVVGLGVALFGLGYWALRLVRAGAIDHPFALILLAGCLLTLVHAWGEFVFQNPAILVTWCAFWPGMVRWCEEEKGP